MRSYQYNMFNIGDIVKSKKGHDKGRFYVVVANNIYKAGAMYVMICDGSLKTASKLKKKNIKHLSYITNSELLKDKLNNKNVSDKEIANEIKTLIGGINV